jgi:cobalt-zinc-cadmium efflux system protein
MLWVAIIGFLGNFVSILLLHKEKEENLNKKAAYLHLLFDTISSVMVILTGIVLYFYPNFGVLDLIISIVISGMVIKSGRGILKKSLHILMQ